MGTLGSALILAGDSLAALAVAVTWTSRYFGLNEPGEPN
jgi:hypothetical protein